MDNLVWPHHVLSYGATTHYAKNLAKTMLDVFGDDLKNWLKYGRFEIKEEKKLDGGLEALCIPMNNDHFRFVIFVSKDDHPIRQDFLIAHEIAHTFFYIRKENQRPKRAFSTNFWGGGNDWEEDFCDAFAKTITGHSYKDVGLSRRKE